MNFTDAIIVVGRGVNLDGTLPLDPKMRIQTALSVYGEAGEVPIVMAGGWSYHLNRQPLRSEAQAMAEYGSTIGIRSQAILQESVSKDTMSGAYYVKTDFALPRHWKTLTIVASEEHIERTEYIFRRIFGPEFNLQFMTSPIMLEGRPLRRMLERERRAMCRARRLLEPIKTGDHAAVFEEALLPYVPGIGPDQEMAHRRLVYLEEECKCHRQLLDDSRLIRYTNS